MITRLFRRICLHIYRVGQKEFIRELDAEIARREAAKSNVHPLFASKSA
jgi:hypothetical protein